MNRRELEIEELIEETVQALGCSVWGVDYAPAGKRSQLRIYIDNPDGVTIEHCEQVSHHVSDLLDVADIIRDAYRLEVSSPGMDRVLFKPDHYEAFKGHQVDVRLNVPLDGRRKVLGVLAGMEDGHVVVQQDEDEYLLPIESIARTRIVPTFE